MFFPAEPEQYGDGERESGVERFSAGLEDFRAGGAFIDLFQDIVVAGFDTEVEDVESGFADLFEFVHVLAQQVRRVGVGGNAFQVGELGVEQVQDFAEAFCPDDESVAVCEEDAARFGREPGAFESVFFKVVEFTDAEFFHLVHAAEQAPVVRAAEGGLDDE